MSTTTIDARPSSLEGITATRNREMLTDAGVFAVHLCGSPGSGKTTLIEATLKRLSVRAQVGVIVAHLAASRDVTALQRAGACAMPLEVSSLDAVMLHDAINSKVLSPQRMDLLLIENPGQTLDASPRDVGQVSRVAVFDVTNGDDKAAESPDVVRDSELLLLTKIDLLPYVRFNLDVFHADVQKINPRLKIMELSCTAAKGLDNWVDWLLAHSLRLRMERHHDPLPDQSESWFG